MKAFILLLALLVATFAMKVHTKVKPAAKPAKPANPANPAKPATKPNKKNPKPKAPQVEYVSPTAATTRPIYT